MAGMLACRTVVLPRATDGALQRRLQRATGVALALLTLASFGILLSRTLELNGGAWATLWHDIRVALAVTHFGHVWLWRLPALLVAWVAWLTASSQRRREAWIMLLALAVIAFTRSATGHPADHGDFTLAVWVDWLHILAAGAWVGSLFAMSLVIFPRLVAGGDRAIAAGAKIFQRLSTLSGTALGVLLAAGIYNICTQLGGVASLWTSRYGAALDVKLAIVLAMIMLGAHNRYIKLPRLLACAGQPARTSTIARWIPASVRTPRTRHPGEALRACARAVLIESLLGLAVIGATATLIHAMPPADMPAMQPLAAPAPR
jgi:putative copper resistance protein D